MTQSEGLLFAMERDDELKQALQEEQDGLRFYKVYKAIARLETFKDTAITWSDKIILCVITSFSEDGKGCFYTNVQLAAELGISERNVRYSLQKLKELEIISIYKKKDKATKSFTSLRRITTDSSKVKASLKETDDKYEWIKQ